MLCSDIYEPCLCSVFTIFEQGLCMLCSVFLGMFFNSVCKFSVNSYKLFPKLMQMYDLNIYATLCYSYMPRIFSSICTLHIINCGMLRFDHSLICNSDFLENIWMIVGYTVICMRTSVELPVFLFCTGHKFINSWIHQPCFCFVQDINSWIHQPQAFNQYCNSNEKKLKNNRNYHWNISTQITARYHNVFFHSIFKGMNLPIIFL